MSKTSEETVETAIRDVLLRKSSALANTVTKLSDDSQLSRLISLVIRTIKSGGNIFVCGNGGSGAEASHFVEELIGRYKSTRRPIAATCLNADAIAMTCIANDFGYEEIFSRQIEALCTHVDLLVLFSTSGRSKNLIRANEMALHKGATTILVCGKSSGDLVGLCSLELNMPSEFSDTVQEAHLYVIHAILEVIETIEL